MEPFHACESFAPWFDSVSCNFPVTNYRARRTNSAQTIDSMRWFSHLDINQFSMNFQLYCIICWPLAEALSNLEWFFVSVDFQLECRRVVKVVRIHILDTYIKNRTSYFHYQDSRSGRTRLEKARGKDGEEENVSGVPKPDGKSPNRPLSFDRESEDGHRKERKEKKLCVVNFHSIRISLSLSHMYNSMDI